MIALPVTTATCDSLIAALQSPSLAVRVEAADALAALGVYADLLLVYGCDETRAAVQADMKLLAQGRYVECEDTE